MATIYDETIGDVAVKLRVPRSWALKLDLEGAYAVAPWRAMMAALGLCLHSPARLRPRKHYISAKNAEEYGALVLERLEAAGVELEDDRVWALAGRCLASIVARKGALLDASSDESPDEDADDGGGLAELEGFTEDPAGSTPRSGA